MAGRILHCIPGMGGGGAERQLAYLSGELVRRGWDVHVALVSGGPNLKRLEAGGATIHYLDAHGNYDPRIWWQLARTIDEVTPDLVQVWMLQMEILGALAARYRGVPWIFSERCSALAYPRTAKNRLRAWVGGHATAVVANSEGGRAYWDGRLTQDRACYVIPNALPIEEIAAVRAADPSRTGVASSKSVVLFAGRLTEQKAPAAFIDALARVLERPDTVAVVAGEGPLRSTLAARVRERGWEARVFLTGYLDDLWAWMKRANVFASPSLFEGHPNTVLEAAACGCPLVISDIPAHREFLDRSAAVVVPAGDAERLAAGILHVLDDAHGARQRAARAAQKVGGLSIGRIAEQYDRVYTEVISRGAVARRAS